MLDLLKRLRRPSIERTLLKTVATEMPLLWRLESNERERLLDLADAFLRHKTIEGAGGLQVSERMRGIIALQAALPVLNLQMDLYRGWHSVILYPDEFHAPFEYTDHAGLVHQGHRRLSGEAWHRGPVILAWTHVEQDARQSNPAGNVVIHELAHKLDMGNGDVNGMPPLHRYMNPALWSSSMSEAYAQLEQRKIQGIDLPIDPYALESPGEFFAVTSELFFAWPERLLAAYPEVFRQLNLYYRQQPLRHFQAAAGQD